MLVFLFFFLSLLHLILFIHIPTHNSILSGGFMAAAQYLHLPDSPLSLTAALVDSDRGALESLLGIVTHNTGEDVLLFCCFVVSLCVNVSGLECRCRFVRP